MIFIIENILRIKQPIGFILENVEGLYKHNNGKTFNTIITRLKNLNYSVTWNILNSYDFGLAQSRKRLYIVGFKNSPISLTNFPIIHNSLSSTLESGLPTVNNNFTSLLLKHFSPSDLIGKNINDKRGGPNNIHSWNFNLKGQISKEEELFLNSFLKERRKKKYAQQLNIQWSDGMPLTFEQIKQFFNSPNLKQILNNLTLKGYLTLKYPKIHYNDSLIKDTSKEIGYALNSGKLSFKFSKILNPNSYAPTLVATDLAHLGVIDGLGLRNLTLDECKKLFGIPLDYNFNSISLRKSYDLFGNTVCVNVIYAICNRIAHKYIENY